MNLHTFKIQISGRVQGVGFRPFVYNLAKQFLLKGTVSNNEKGVLIFVNATEEYAHQFYDHIKKNKPSISIIQSTSIEKVRFTKLHSFDIIRSSHHSNIDLPLTPDFAICETCKTEINDKNNRRYHYAFTTCVHCGPRYAISTAYPFERENTQLSNFEMCADCKNEYENPENKRFHSQTNSCYKCGIQLVLTDNNGKIISENQEEILTQINTQLKEGKIISIKNTYGYLLCCDATNLNAINLLREKKKRFHKPFAILYPHIEAIKNDFILTKNEAITLQSSVAPIVILQNSKATSLASSTIAPHLNQTGVMLPSSSLLELVMQKFKNPIIATSGNIHGSPIIATQKEAESNLKNVADFFVHHNLKIEFPQDDSVVKFVEEQQIILRRSRGLSPNFLEKNTNSTEPILAMGAHLKSTFSFVPNQHIYTSQYFGNLDSYEVSERYKNTINKYCNLFNVKPKTILVDKHPSYQSSIFGKELAQESNAKCVEIQHHKAHFASVLGEHNLFSSKEKILGVIWDGTGLGEEDNIWGGEFFIYEKQKIKRQNHFEYFNWIANDKMAKEPRLSLFSLLNKETRDLIQDKFSTMEWNIYTKTINKNTLKTSSVGRLFDAVASALDLVDINSYEAEAPMLLENYASLHKKEDYMDLLKSKNYDAIPSQLLVQTITKSYKLDGDSKSYLAASFIYTLATLIIKEAQKNKVKTIACSGGVFQNTLLVKMLTKKAKIENINLKFNRKLSPNDENVSFGQLMYHQHIKN